MLLYVSLAYFSRHSRCRKDSIHVAERCFLYRQNLTMNDFHNTGKQKKDLKEKGRAKVKRYVKNMLRLRHTPNA